MIIGSLIANFFWGKKRYQAFFEFLHRISLWGLNIGQGSDFFNSGELNLLKDLALKFSKEKSVIIFDVGANVGKYSIFLASYFSVNSRIFSFEPSKKTFTELVKNTKFYRNIIPFNFGLGEESGYCFLYSDKQKSGLASLYKRKLDHLGISFNIREKVKVITLDDFCRINGIDRISFLKIDTEGSEFSVLKGAKRMIEKGKISYST